MVGRVALILLILFTTLLRLQNFNAVFGSEILYTGYDPYYHMRLVEVIVREGFRPEYDYFLNYPYGLKILWPPLFDYLIALPGIIFGFKASEVFAAVLPVLLGVLCVLMVYLVALEVIKNQTFALISAFIYSVTPVAIQRSVLGFADYHVLIVLLFLVSLYFLMKRGFIKIISGIPMLFLTLTWLGAPIYGAIVALASALSFDVKEMRFAAASFAIPAISFFFNPMIGLSFLALSAFLFFGSIVKIYEERFRNAVIYYVSFSFAILLLSYFLPVEFVRSGINYITGADVFLPTISEARSLQIYEVISSAGYIYFILALISLLLLKNRFLVCLFVFSLALALMQLRFVEVLAVSVSILSAYAVCLILERLEYPVFESKKGEKEDRKKRRREVKASWKDHTAVVLFLLILAVPCIVIAVMPFDLNEDWRLALEWLRDSLEGQNYLNPYEKPHYAILSWWDYGNWILYVSKKAVVCNNFQAGAVDAAKFFTSRSEEEALKIARERGAKYVITADEITMMNPNKTKFPAIMQIAGYNSQQMTAQEILDFFNSTILYKLHTENASNLTHFKLVREFGSVKIFEVI